MFKSKRDVLHSGNILNNGYLHCKYLRNRGIRADSLNIDYTHCQGQPEWTEVTISGAVPEWDADLSQLASDFVRPDWYLHGDRQSLPDLERKAFGAPKFGKLISDSALRRVQDALNRRRQGRLYNRLMARKQSWYEELIESYQTYFPDREDPLTFENIEDWAKRSDLQASLMKRYPLIQGYGADAVYALVGAPGKPYICYEHGHLRELPFDNTSLGKVYALALKRSAKVIITNSDCIDAAQKLELDNTVFIPHLIDDEKFKPGPSTLGEKIRSETGCEYILLAPARHHWKNFPNGLIATWNKGNDVIIKGVANLRRQRPDMKICLVFFEWGQEVGESKRLIEECGIADIVRWEQLCSKPIVKDFMNAADIVLDQFNEYTGSFGAIVPETMACAKPIIMTFKPETHHWCYPELPPVISAAAPEELTISLKKLLDDDDYRSRVGAAGLEWYRKHHSSDVVIDKMIDVYDELWDRAGHRPSYAR